METVGERIRHLRKKVLNKTQKEFGEKIGLKSNSVSDIESGKNNLTEQTANAICREYGINKKWLLTGDGEMMEEPEDEIATIVSDLLEEDNPFYELILGIMKTYQNLDSKSQELLKNLGKQLLDNLKKRD